jgi:iron complex outermembrane receptor protein
VIRTINAASSKVYGIDFDLSYAPRSVPGLRANLAVNWNHARFEKFDNSPCYGGQRVQDGCDLFLNPDTGNYQAQDLSGAPLPKAADWTVSGGIDYKLPVGDALELALGANAQYSSKFLRGLGRYDGLPGMVQPAYAKINANVGIGAENGTWELSLIGKNLTDKFTAGNCTQFSAATGQVLLPPLTGATTRNAAGLDETACITDRGREIFLRLTLRPTAR